MANPQYRYTDIVDPDFEEITSCYPNTSVTHSSANISPICREVNFPVPPSISLASAIVNRIRLIHAKLSEFGSLSPCPTTNQLFTELVGLCCVEFDKNVVEEVLNSILLRNILPSLRNMCSGAEYELELHWAKKINGAADMATATQHYSSFPYAANYEELTKMEMANFYPNVRPEDTGPINILFIGSGPLPMTSIFLFDFINQTGQSVNITNMDRCPNAIRLSQGLVDKLECLNGGPNGSKMEFLCQDASATADTMFLRQFHIIYLAALVGETIDDKIKLIRSITSRLNKNALIIIRSAHSLRKVLYTGFPLRNSVFRRCGLVPIQVVHPLNNVVNSVIIAAPESS